MKRKNNKTNKANTAAGAKSSEPQAANPIEIGQRPLVSGARTIAQLVAEGKVLSESSLSIGRVVISLHELIDQKSMQDLGETFVYFRKLGKGVIYPVSLMGLVKRLVTDMHHALGETIKEEKAKEEALEILTDKDI